MLLKARNKFTGIVGSEPDTSYILNELSNADLFLYFGHGGCEKLVTARDISKLAKNRHVPTVLLFGCSSGFLKPNGRYDPHGIALDYLAAGSPAVLGNLWDVTDIDIDKYAKSLLGSSGIFEHSKLSLCEAASLARDVCLLPYLVGASPVIYGLPLYISKS